jgi:hypothetical protein
MIAMGAQGLDQRLHQSFLQAGHLSCLQNTKTD